MFLKTTGSHPRSWFRRQYDPTSDFWSQADDTSSLLPRVRQRHLMSEYRGRLYTFSGELFVWNDTLDDVL